MRWSPMSGLAVLVGLALTCPSPAAGEGAATLPMPEMVVPKAATPPTIDGRMAPGEWDHAPAATAFTVAFQPDLAKTQSVAWVTFDDAFVYVCMKNYRGAGYDLLKKTARAVDDEAIVFDHANEIWITPPASPTATYQTLFNAYPGVYDCKKIPSVGYTAKSWQGRWTIASSETAEAWIVEAKAPLGSFGVERVRDGDQWGALFTTDVLSDPGGGFRAWAPGGAFEDIHRHGRLHFRDDAPAFQILDVETVFTGRFTFPMALAAPRGAGCRASVTLRFGAAPQAGGDDLLVTQDVVLAAGERKTFDLSGDLSGLALPRRTVTVNRQTKEQKEVPAGFCEVTARTSDGTTLYHQVFPFVIDGFRRRPPATIRSTPYETPFGLQAFYAPLARKLIVKVDRYYMAAREGAVAGTARLVSRATGKAVAERPVAPFYYDYSEFPMDLGGLQVPVQTEADWREARPVEEENRRIAKENEARKTAGQPPLPLKDVPGPRPAACDLEVTLAARDGTKLATTRIPVELMGYQFEWLPNEVGLSDQVIPPWTPLEYSEGQVRVWNRAYRMNGLGLAETVTNAGAPQLAGPMRLVAVVDGKRVEVAAGKPSAARLTPAAAHLGGTGRAGGLRFDVATVVEFDGFVLNRMTVVPEGPGRLDRLTLEVAMPRREAPCFVTTAGGWAAYHGWTPDRWDSRETSSGSRVGNFVPYVLLTDSERGFCWFADNDRGWLLDPAAPTQELVRDGDLVTLRIHFVTRPTTLAGPTTIEYGWMVTPQKPMPDHWRAYTIASHRPYPEARCVFWMDADWAVLWPYYSSPYPWDMAKSRKAIEGAAANGITGCVGAIAHAIARYRDWKDRWFNPLAADWGSDLGDLGNGNVARGRGPNDFQVWHYDRWVREGGLAGLYFDENYLSEDRNYLAGGAYLLPDERIQPGYTYLGLREFNKRLRYMFHANGKPPPCLWLHTTSGQPVYAWMPDVAMEGENVEPASMENDYMECLPASRLRSIGMGANLGAAPMIMCQADRHYNEAHSPLTIPQFVGWVLAHDCLPEGAPFWPVLASELEVWHDDIRFLPYWKEGGGIESSTKDVLVSAHVRKGRAVLWIVNTARDDRRATVRVDLGKLGLDPARTIAFDAETGEPHDLGDGTLALDVPKRFWRAVRLVAPAVLAKDQTFVARFDAGQTVADEALGHRYPKPLQGGVLPKAEAGGKTGKGFAMDAALEYGARHHVAPERGSIAMEARFDSAASGVLLGVGDLRLSLNKGGLSLALQRSVETDAGGQKRTTTQWQEAAKADTGATADASWHHVVVGWRGKEVEVRVDGRRLLAATLDRPLVPPMARGRQILSHRLHTQPPTVTFGPVKGAILDEVVMSR